MEIYQGVKVKPKHIIYLSRTMTILNNTVFICYSMLFLWFLLASTAAHGSRQNVCVSREDDDRCYGPNGQESFEARPHSSGISYGCNFRYVTSQVVSNRVTTNEVIIFQS